ncbi:protein IQ-DOMAIN 31-like isoform X2 [Phoenix dactylifera]|uniref:Protein IQ-DOMAIN 31-like isoform X2 n=1 Tax=Phoenix dactylifera TaxID=42345 RepID=A0A8B7BGT7_PHODC|nr:protein IQ-DOMAIN 31-like isoform X2 [Phoenix dactylifera]
MGKSPGKWIKTLLSGKKSARSHATNGTDASKSGTDKGYSGGKGPPALAGNSPVISEPVLVSTGNNEIIPNLEKGTPSTLVGDGVVLSATSQDAEKQESARYEASNDPAKLREEQAAIKAQAAFRAYLARRAFHALKGIIRLQALIRGHLVRRQAVATLRAWQGIVKLQAVVRGQRVRCSSIGFKIHTKLAQGNAAVTTIIWGDAKPLDSWKEKLLTNAFFRKLLSSSHIAKPLQIQYDQGDPNPVFSWLERWTSTHFWKLLERPKKATDAKSHTRRCSYAMETESARSKRSVRRNSAVNVDPAQTNVTSEPEKTKCNLRKVSGSPADSVQDRPQTEIEKVKRNLRRVSNSITEASDHLEVETEKPIRNVRKVSSSPFDVPDQGLEKGVIPTPETKPEVETVSKSAVMEGPADALPDDSSATELHQLQRIDNEEKALVVNGELSSMEELPCLESQKTKKGRSSFSARSEYAENGLQNTPVLPSYMATTESSKAKFRGQISPRFGSDSVDKNVDKNGISRRHSLPSSTNGKLSSPRTQILFPANGKWANRSFFSSRDGNERALRVEWRR